MRLEVVWVLAGSACGRFGFGALHDAAPGGDGVVGDGVVGDGGFGALHDAAPGDGVVGDAILTTLQCSVLPATCGPAATSSCCASSTVPGGTYYRSYDVASDGAFPDMTNPATVSTFVLDTYEATVARFRQFVMTGGGTQQNPPRAGVGAHPLIANSGWDPAWNASLPADTATLTAGLKCGTTRYTWTDAPGANESLPINCITWFEAFAFCAADGGFLPTEAEWNYAATGGSEQRAYPWSVPPSTLVLDCAHANWHPSTFCVGMPDRVGSESPAGDGKWGHADLSGNVLEWTLDWDATYPLPCIDCANLTATATTRIARGGFFGNSTDTNLRAAHRGNSVPTTSSDSIGVRCAR